MCFLGQQKYLAVGSQQKISSLTPEQLALKKKNDKRAFALLKALASHQVSSSRDLSGYPVLANALKAYREAGHVQCAQPKNKIK